MVCLPGAQQSLLIYNRGCFAYRLFSATCRPVRPALLICGIIQCREQAFSGSLGVFGDKKWAVHRSMWGRTKPVNILDRNN